MVLKLSSLQKEHKFPYSFCLFQILKPINILANCFTISQPARQIRSVSFSAKQRNRNSVTQGSLILYKILFVLPVPNDSQGFDQNICKYCPLPCFHVPECQVILANNCNREWGEFLLTLSPATYKEHSYQHHSKEGFNISL